ncbi:hypothetical protein HAX54_046296 [Datura stramonium]|uniref:Uncharacterized protein n=1 Tax=Datura stramonium TaxID=4076 RepID=A0ABS8SRQ6_DATST|nr:hypothetical protein [Datura stramonium]
MASETSPSLSVVGTQLTDNLILDTPISSNPPSSPSSTDTQNSPSSKVHVVPVDPTIISHRNDNTGDQGKGVAVDSPVVAKEGTEVHPKEGSDLSTETLFEGGLMESKEGTPNILQSEAKIIEGFITDLGTREKEVRERSPSAEGSRSNSGDGNCPFVQESGEPSYQEAPPVAASPKWDGTPTLSNVEVPEPSASSVPAEGTSSPPDDDEGLTGTKGGPTTRGTVKKSLDLILEESRQNTLKSVMEEIPKVEKKSLRSAKVSKKGKQLSVVEKSVEGSGAPVQRSKRKHFIEKGMQELIEIVNYQGREHLFALPMPIMYEAEVTEFYISLQSLMMMRPCLLSQVRHLVCCYLQEENALLKGDNAALRKQLEDLTQQMIHD